MSWSRTGGYDWSVESAFQEALNLIFRWIHVIAGIMWIGDSFLFMWLDSHLETPRKQREGAVVGELWMTHSGGFYEVVKRKYLARDEMPPNLYWFKWESYTTWITGFLMLFIVYYMNGASYLIDPSVSAMTTAEGIALSLALLAGGFIVYDALWSSPLKKHPWVLAPLCFIALIAIAAWISTLYSGRAAYIQIGAMMGTIMSANVFFRIIPAQRNMLAAAKEGREVDVSLGLRAKMRSRHNHYMTLPVVFTMLSNHFPATFGHEHPWLLLAVVFLFGAGLKYLMNYRGKAGPVVWIGTLGALVATVVLSSGPSVAAHDDDALKTAKVSWPEVHRIVQARCTNCHAAVPSNMQFKSPPAGIVLEDPAQIAKLSPRIFERVFVNETMPLGNQTNMLPEERFKVAAWIAQGSIVKEAPRWEGAAPPEPLIAEAKALYAARCVTCHGPDGRGDGPSSKAMLPGPTNLHDRAWHAQISDDELAKVLLGGGPALGKAATMPPNMDLAERPELIAALVHLVRLFEDPQPEAAPGFPNVDRSPRPPAH